MGCDWPIASRGCGGRRLGTKRSPSLQTDLKLRGKTGLWDHRPICRSFPKPQTDLCLWRGHAVGGERQADSWERWNKANAETPAAHLLTKDTKTNCICSPLWVSGWTESASCREMQRMKRGRQSTEEYVSRQLEWWPTKSGLIFSKCFSVEIKHFYICSLCPLRILKALKQTETALGVFAKVTSD